MNLWALLEIHHDSDNGPEDVNFEHKITLHRTKADAERAKTEAMQAVRNSELAMRVGVMNVGDEQLVRALDLDCEVVLRSDDWWRWEVYEVNVPEEAR